MRAITSATILASLSSQQASAAWTNGLNMPWNQCGNDWGTAYDKGFFESAFAKYSTSGADTLRVWIHFDGAKQLSLYDKDGHFKQLPAKFYSDAKHTFETAKQHKLKLHITLFSFECVNNNNCHNMMSTANKSQSYLDNGLSPVLKFIKDNGFADQVSAIELFNEPEWMIEGGSGVQRKIDLGSVQRFTTSANKVITDAGFAATVGSASLKWTCTKGHWCVGDWWGATGQTFRTVHYYGWMSQGGSAFDPFSTTPSDWGLTGDVLVGEAPSWADDTVSHGKLDVKGQFYMAHKNGWSGLMPWADVGMSNYGNIDTGLKCASNWDSCAVSSPATAFLQI